MTIINVHDTGVSNTIFALFGESNKLSPASSFIAALFPQNEAINISALGTSLGKLTSNNPSLAMTIKEELAPGIAKLSAVEQGNFERMYDAEVNGVKKLDVHDEQKSRNHNKLDANADASRILNLQSAGQIAQHSNLPKIAVVEKGAYKIAGLEVVGNTLRGNVLVKFTDALGTKSSQNDRNNVVRQLLEVNGKANDGSKNAIDLKIREHSYSDKLSIFPWSETSAEVNVLFVDSMKQTNCGKLALACFDPDRGFLKIVIGASDRVVLHEFVHNLGLNHNSNVGSLMYPVNVPLGKDYISNGEITNIINFYKK